MTFQLKKKKCGLKPNGRTEPMALSQWWNPAIPAAFGGCKGHPYQLALIYNCYKRTPGCDSQLQTEDSAPLSRYSGQCSTHRQPHALGELLSQAPGKTQRGEESPVRKTGGVRTGPTRRTQRREEERAPLLQVAFSRLPHFGAGAGCFLPPCSSPAHLWFFLVGKG